MKNRGLRSEARGPTRRSSDAHEHPRIETLEIAALPNLGPKSAAILAAAGVRSVEQLVALGSVAAYRLAKRSDARVSLNLLWALEAALCGESWQEVARKYRTSLLLALEADGGAKSGTRRGKVRSTVASGQPTKKADAET